MANKKKPYHLTGGLQWHLTALRRGGEWADLRCWVEQLILREPAFGGPLLVFGPSAGWTLPRPLPTHFDPVVGVDMDPLAMWLFRIRHGGAQRNIRWIQRDFMDHLDDILPDWPDATVMFANTLGQQGFLQGLDNGLETRLANLQQRLHGWRWLSYHDRLSFKVADSASGQALMQHLSARLPALQTLPLDQQGRTEALIDALRLTDFTPPGGWLKVLDHRTGAVLPPETQRTHCLWAIRPHQIHLLEGGWAPARAQ